MTQDPKKELWTAIQSNPDTKDLFVDESDFDSLLTADPKGVYTALEPSGLFVDYADFESVSGLKKKGDGALVSPVGSGASQPTSKVDTNKFSELAARVAQGDDSAKEEMRMMRMTAEAQRRLSTSPKPEKPAPFVESEFVTEVPATGQGPRFMSEEEQMQGGEGMAAGQVQTSAEAVAASEASEPVVRDIVKRQVEIAETPTAKLAAKKKAEYEAIKPLADTYRRAQEDFSDLDFLGAQERMKEAKGRDDYAAATIAEQELNAAYDKIDEKYFNYLSFSRPELAQDQRSQYDAIRKKMQEGGTNALSEGEQQFMTKVRNESMGLYYNAKKAELYELESGHAVKQYFNQAPALIGQLNKKIEEANALAESPLTAESKQRLSVLSAEISDLEKKYRLLEKETNVTPEVADKASAIYGSMEATGNELGKAGDKFYDIAEQEMTARIRKANRQGEGVVPAIVYSFGEAINTSLASAMKFPKTMFEGEEGRGEYGWVDRLYNYADNYQNYATDILGQPYTPEEWENMSILDKTPYLLGQGIGSATLFAGGGVLGAGLKIPRAAITAQAFLMGEPMAYDEAIAAGMDVSEAKTAARTIGAVEAILEGYLVNDLKFFDAPKFRKGIIAQRRAGDSMQKAVRDNVVDAVKDIAAGAREEFGEEGAIAIAGATTRGILNATFGQEFYQDIYNPEDIAEQSFTGLLTGGFMRFMAQFQIPRSEATEDVMLSMAERPELVQRTTAYTDTETQGEALGIAQELREKLEGLKGQPNFQSLSRAKQAHVLSELDRKAKLEESMRVAGIKPESTLAEIAAIETEIKSILDAEIKPEEDDKKDEQGIPSGVREGEAPVSEQPVEGAGAEAIEAGGVLQAQEEVELEPTVAESQSGSVVGGEVKTMDDFDTFKDAVAFNVKRTADIDIDESEANYGDAKNINEIKSDLEKAGIQVEKVSKSLMSDGNYASFDGYKIKVTDENIPLQVLLHEIGEKVVLDLDKAKQRIEHANNIFEAVTTYGASRGNDAFADNFYLYFLSPQTLKDLSPNVYAELDKLIPQNIKDLGKSLMSKYGVTEQTLKYNKPKAEKQSPQANPLTETQIPTDAPTPSTDNAVIGEVRLPDIGVEGKREGDAVKPAVDVGADTGDAEATGVVELTEQEELDYAQQWDTVRGSVMEVDPNLSDAEADYAATMVQASNVSPEEAVRMAKENPDDVAAFMAEEAVEEAPMAEEAVTEGEVAADNVGKFLSDSGISVEVLDDADYKNTVSTLGGQQSESEGIFVADDKKVYINRDKIKNEWGKTIAYHEGTHPVINIIRNTNPALYKTIVSGIMDAAKTNPNVARVVNMVKNNPEYKKAGQAVIEDETVVEVLAQIAAGKLDFGTFEKTTREKIIDFMNTLAEFFGLPKIALNSPRTEVQNLAKKLTDALNKQGSIADVVGKKRVGEFQNKINLDDTQNVFKNDYSQARFEMSFFEDTKNFKKLVKNGRVIHNADLSQFDNEVVVIHNPDSFFTGNIKFRGKKLVDGEGGIYFVLKYDDVWASGKKQSASSMSSLINESLEKSSDGKARIVLIKGDPNKNLTSVKGAKALMGVLEILADDGLIPLYAFRKALNIAGKKYNINFDGRNDTKSIHKDIQDKFMNVSNSSFERRGDFVADVIDEISKQNVLSKDDISKIAESIEAKRKMTTFSKASIMDSVSYATTERMLQDVPNSHAYAVIEVSSKVKPALIEKHESYPWHIVTEDGSKPTLYILKDRPYFNDVFVAAKSTEKVKEGDRFEDVSRAGLAQRGMNLARIKSAGKPVGQASAMDRGALKDVESTAKALKKKEKTNEDEVLNLEGDANIYINDIVGKRLYDIIDSLSFSKNVKKAVRIHFSISDKGEFISSLGADKIIKSNDIDRTKKFIKNIGAEILRDKYGESSKEYGMELDKLNASVNNYIQSLLDAEEKGTEPKIDKNIANIASVLFDIQNKFSEIESEIPNNTAEAYHAAKKDGSNPELVRAVEELLSGERLAKVQASAAMRREARPTVRKTSQGYQVISVDGKPLSRPNLTEGQAKSMAEKIGRMAPAAPAVSEAISEIDTVLEQKGKNAAEARRSFKEKYGQDAYDRAREVTLNFDKIINDLEQQGRVRKDCP